MRKFFFIDYDNTIFSHYSNSIPEGVSEALLGLQQAGHKVILASGRGLSDDLLPALPKDFIPDGLVGANGAIVEIDGQRIWENPMNPSVKNRLIDFVQEKEYFLITSSEGEFYVSNLKRFQNSRFRETEPKLPKGDEDFNILRTKPVFSFFMNEPLEIIEDTQRHFPDLKLFYMGERMGGADVIPAENGKIKGIERILDHYGTDFQSVVAIGDSMNDLEMIQAAGIGIAMGNAMPEVKKAADYVAKDIDKGGLADAIRYALA